MNRIYIFTILITFLFQFSVADEVVGCGGFLKSHVPIDFSKVEVKLVTKQGIVKDRTTAAPNNGYYFVPLYDKGEMLLELSPPTGWSFEPKRVAINVDGVNDLCSQGKDINFVFHGFGITGKVESLGSDSRGPKGVTVHLQSDRDEKVTVTDDGGNFFFTPVYPGDYELSISHQRWKIYKKSLNINVADSNSGVPKHSLIIQGYEVSGMVISDGEPVKDVTVSLYSEEMKSPEFIDGCNKQLLKVSHKAQPLCHSLTDENGRFKFGTVPSGRYFVEAIFQKQNIHYQPKQIHFVVEHTDVQLDKHFEITGFSIPGRILKAKGKPVPNAKIFLNGVEVTKTDDKGAYRLERMKSGTYRIDVGADDFKFDQKLVRLHPSHQELPDILPSAFKVCGTVVSDQPQVVTFTGLRASKVIETETSSTNGSFCQYLIPGKYEVQVAVKEEDKQKRLQFFPMKQSIEVSADTMPNLVFSQLKATVFGKIKCIQQKDCDDLAVAMKTENLDEVIIKVKGGGFSISDVYPGTYEINLLPNRFCWEGSKHIINVNSEKVEVSPFVQTGYVVDFVFSHDTKVRGHLAGDSRTFTIEVKKARSSYCLDKPGEYTLTLDSCHSFSPNTFVLETDAVKEITANAEKHTQTLCIKAASNFGDLKVIVTVGTEQFDRNLTYSNGCYMLDILLERSESAVVVPKSDTLFFTPPILPVQGADDCTYLGVKFVAIKGKLFQGKIVPPLEGVTVTAKGTDSERLVVETDTDGVYKFPPLDSTKEYVISAAKDSYLLAGPDNNGNFLAYKLAEIVVEVVDAADNTSLAGVLLSLSGGDNYRKNLQSGENGKITFHSLSPNEYFLRPMMKEYVFEPASMMISVLPGQTVNVPLVGRRVAYSAYGQVVSLNGDSEDDLVVIAKGINNCSSYTEETTCERNGIFRIRGLHPYCSYVVEIKGNENSAVERSVPASISIDGIKEDVKGLRIIVFRPAVQMEILLKVYAENVDYYKSLKVKLQKEPGITIVKTKVDSPPLKLTKSNNPGVMLYLPAIPIDNKPYSVHLKSSAAQNAKLEFRSFIANSSFGYFELDFVAKNNVTEQRIKQTSILSLMFIFTALVGVYNVQIIADVLKNRLNFNVSNLTNFIPLPSSSQKTNGDYFDDADIDQIVQNINNTKKKTKTKWLKKN